MKRLHQKPVFLRMLALVGILFSGFALNAEAKIGVILMESVPGTAAYVSQGGHTALLLSETCTDDYLSMRPCTSADPVWGVIAERTASFSSKAKYDWLVMPVSTSLFALENNTDGLLVTSPRIRKKLIENFYLRNKKFRNLVVNSDPEFEKGMKLEKGFRFPTGRWQNFFGSQLRRSIYTVWINDLTGTKERELVKTINGFSNRPKFGVVLFLFAGNCSKWVQDALKRVEGFEEAGFGQNWLADGTFTSPKGVTEEAFSAARKIMAKSSDVFVTIELMPQVPGTYPKSKPPYFVIESVFKNRLVWPVVAFFHPIVYLVGRFYFKFIKGFSIQKKYEQYFSYQAASVSVFGSASEFQGSKKKVLKKLRDGFFGSKSWWKEKRNEFHSMLLRAKALGVIDTPKDVEKGRLLKRLLDENSEAEVDSYGVPWLIRRSPEGIEKRAGLTNQTVDKGDPG
ncbi:MAG: hypothetical protein HKN33_01025, partial [Pyrinomonadaceae bacterium]|nr:hypothetical protein [Pyrinomonadaceae bacterium]